MQEYETGAIPSAQSQALERAFVAKVFVWMTWGLMITAVVAAAVANVPSLTALIYGNPGVWIALIVVELIMVFGLAAGINRLSAATASVMFIVYSALNGATLSFVFLVYTGASVTSTFFVTAGMFGAMAAYGYVTKRDLTGIGSFCLMALIGIILASVVNFFLHSDGLYWIITYAGIAIFVGLTAYDVQKIRRFSGVMAQGQEAVRKAAVMGALALYLDFINLFILLLRILGRRK